MREQNLCELSSQIADTQKSLWHGRVNRMCTEIELLSFDGDLDRDSVDDILLRTVLNTNKSESKLNIFSFDHSLGAGTLVHDIDFGNNTNSSNTLRINLSGHLKTV